MCCERLFDTAKALTLHKSCWHPSVQDELKYACNLCDTKFKSINERRQHFEDIHKIKNSELQKRLNCKCSLCGKQYKNLRSLSGHKKAAHSALDELTRDEEKFSDIRPQMRRKLKDVKVKEEVF